LRKRKKRKEKKVQSENKFKIMYKTGSEFKDKMVMAVLNDSTESLSTAV